MKKTIYSEESRVLTAWLRECRKRKGLTIRALAAELGVPHSWIGKVEIGERRLDVVEYVHLCRALGVDPLDGIKELLSHQQPALEYPSPPARKPAKAAEDKQHYGLRRH